MSMASCVACRMLGGPERTPSSFASPSLLKAECDQTGEKNHENHIEKNNHKFAGAGRNCHRERSNDREEIADDRGRKESYCGRGCLRKEEQRAGRSNRRRR